MAWSIFIQTGSTGPGSRLKTFCQSSWKAVCKETGMVKRRNREDTVQRIGGCLCLRVEFEYKSSQFVELLSCFYSLLRAVKQSELIFTHTYTHTLLYAPQCFLWILCSENWMGTQRQVILTIQVSTMSLWSKHGCGRRGLFLRCFLHPIMHFRTQVSMSIPCFMHGFPLPGECSASDQLLQKSVPRVKSQ